MLLILASLSHHCFCHWYIFPCQNSHMAQITRSVVPVCRRAASYHSTTDTTIQNPPHPSGSAHKRPSSSPSPISIQHRKPSSFPSPINSQHRRPPSSSSPTCSQPKLPPASPTPINSQHRKATVSSSPNRNTSLPEVTHLHFGEQNGFLRFLDLPRHKATLFTLGQTNKTRFKEKGLKRRLESLVTFCQHEGPAASKKQERLFLSQSVRDTFVQKLPPWNHDGVSLEGNNVLFLLNVKVPHQNPSGAAQHPHSSWSSRPSPRRMRRFILLPSLLGRQDLSRLWLFSKRRGGRRICWRSHAQKRPTMCQTQLTQLHTEVERRSLCACLKPFCAF